MATARLVMMDCELAIKLVNSKAGLQSDLANMSLRFPSLDVAIPYHFSKFAFLNMIEDGSAGYALLQTYSRLTVAEVFREPDEQSKQMIPEHSRGPVVGKLVEPGGMMVMLADAGASLSPQPALQKHKKELKESTGQPHTPFKNKGGCDTLCFHPMAAKELAPRKPGIFAQLGANVTPAATSSAGRSLLAAVG